MACAGSGSISHRGAEVLGQRTVLLLIYGIISMCVSTLRCIIECSQASHQANLLSLLDSAFDSCQGIVLFLVFGLDKKQKIFESLSPLTTPLRKYMCSLDYSLQYQGFKYDLFHMVAPSIDLLHLNHVHREVSVIISYS